MILSASELSAKIHQACVARYVDFAGQHPSDDETAAWKPAEKRIFQIMQLKQIEIQSFQHEFLKALRQVSREIEYSYHQLDEIERCRYSYLKQLLCFIAICTLARL